jgi:hypothetical protein
MIKTLLSIWLASAVLAFLLIPTTSAHAGWPIGVSSAELERYYRPGAYVPYDGAGLMQRYNFDQGGAIFFGYDGRRLAYFDYLDRLERQQHFGHLWPSRKRGCVYQIQRIENEYWMNWAMQYVFCHPW